MKFRIAETETFRKRIAKPQFRRYYAKIRDYVYPILRNNPYFGPNIRRLKGDYAAFYRYRIGQQRLFYTVSADEVTVYVIDIEHRGKAYK